MPEYEPDKFIVINRKHIEKIKSIDSWPMDHVANSIQNGISIFKGAIKKIGVPDNKYYVCNQDEPYAQKVLDVILEGEREKEIINTQQGPL